MERADISEFIDLDDVSRVPSSDGSVTVLQAEEDAKGVKITPEKRGRRVYSDVELEESYSRQRAAAPKQNIFK